MKGYHRKEKQLTKKVEELENKLNRGATSRFGTGKLLSNLEGDEIEITMSELSNKRRLNGQSNTKTQVPKKNLHNSIPSDLTMQSIDSLEELMVQDPESS